MPMSLRLICLLSCLLSLVLTPPARCDAASDVAAANSHLKRAEANLQLVEGSIGHLTKPPTGSAAKLSKMRLDQAFGDIEPAGKLLSALGGKGAGVAEATARYNAAVQLHQRLGAILSGETPEPEPEPVPDPRPEPGPQPEPDPKPKPKPKPEEQEAAKGEPEAPKTVKLGYPHADNFKNTLFTLRRVEADTAGLVKLLEELRVVEDPLGIDHRTSARAMATIQETRRQAGFVRDGLAKIPANGEGVAEAVQRLVNADASLAVAQSFFEPLDAQLRELVNPANYPEFDQDVKRLRELASGYANSDYLFREQRAQAAELLGQGEAAKAECIRIAQAYARLLEQQTDQGKRLEAAGNGFLSSYEGFLAAAEQQKASLPADIRKDLAEADRMADEAVQNQKPMWFTGGIPQQLEWVDDKLALYTVLDAAGAGPLQQEVDATKASLRQRADSLKELIIRENPLPADRYAGADRDAAVAVAKDAWKIQEPDFELLAVRIPSEAWSRETKWTYSNGTWYFVDESTLQVRLIVADKENPAQAIDRPVNVRKDHQKGDTMIGVPMRSFDEELQPSEYLLRTRIQ